MRPLRVVGLVGMLGLGLGQTGAAAAGPLDGWRGDRAGGLPSYEIATILRSTGLLPLSQAHRIGPDGDFYVLRAADRHGTRMRVVVDAETGEIVSIAPIRNWGPGPRRYPRFGALPSDDDELAPFERRERPPRFGALPDTDDEVLWGEDDMPLQAAPPPRDPPPIEYFRDLRKTKPPAASARRPAPGAVPLPKPRPGSAGPSRQTALDPPAAGKAAPAGTTAPASAPSPQGPATGLGAVPINPLE